MNDETLERLMIDDSVGALGADVRELLGAYVTSLPNGMERLQKWRSAADALTQQISDVPVEVLPAFGARANRGSAWKMAGASALATAAALVIGMGIGLHWPRQVAVTPPSGVMVSWRTTEQVTETENDQGFWSSKRLLAMATERKQEQQTTVRGGEIK